MRKSIINLTCRMLLLVALSACESDSDEALHTPRVAFNEIQVTQVHEGDDLPVTQDQLFRFTDGRIRQYISRQTIQAVEPVILESLTTITYDDREQTATITDEAGNVLLYALNEQGYATSCTHRRNDALQRSYTFRYQTDETGRHYLTDITERLADGNIYAFLTMEYDMEGSLRISRRVDSQLQDYTATFDAAEAIPNKGEVPFFFLTEQHPLSAHTAALYGKLLGEPFPWLLTQLKPDSDADPAETVTYRYKTSDGALVSQCAITTKSNGLNYQRSIAYSFK